VSTLCYWCHEELPPLPEDSSYVDEINHYIHDECRDERDEKNRCMEEMRAGIADGSIDSIPGDIRTFVLDRIKSQGFSRRAPVPLRRRLRLSGLRDALVRRKR
jgi:hypothetical protein